MKVSFEKLDHRYRVYIQRDRAPDLWMYGPGYDDELPHDILHFVAEAEFGLDAAIYGDLAAGGNAKLFMPFDKAEIAKLWRHKRMHKYVLPEGARSERLAHALECAWRRHRPADWGDRLAAADAADERVQTLVPRLDALAAEWRALPVGGRMTLEWPRPEGRKRHPPRDRRRPARR